MLEFPKRKSGVCGVGFGVSKGEIGYAKTPEISFSGVLAESEIL